MNVLIIEDNQDIAASIYDYLESLGYTVDAAGDGVTGLHLAITKNYDVIILDLGLPGIDGIELCQRLRQDAHRTVPVIMLTARDTLDNKLEGFQSGTDDYLIKPFALKELAARVKVLSERARHAAVSKLQVGDLCLDLETHEVSRAGKYISLNPTLFRLLAFLMQNPHRVIKREELEHAVWQENPPDSDALRTHLSNLRQMIDKPFGYSLIHTVRGFGYRLTDRYAED
ncbi:DNA-binding response regulator, OmpR family, contains REC and winged-helix (wHTH) domain [Nitrosomonas marina]|uniref:DNA-binding response regulator, OmpR family, contains REC and winged-helix (WHTH) domain n=1 Tax=Nitrosomonas marina TaxID=917 RepID=A0A1H9YQR3_9PROT|nr:response regulator transcription factor [Nitrosomonas marina]SES71401.1 DNA-binding response regulator, OmpR family, contains REC and winged-helix (wHTH) domain [Nitrosomonas marina]